VDGVTLIVDTRVLANGGTRNAGSESGGVRNFSNVTTGNSVGIGTFTFNRFTFKTFPSTDILNGRDDTLSRNLDGSFRTWSG
jgi:hypothetical protein